METKEYSFKDLLSRIVDNRGKTCPTAESGTALIATNCVKNDGLYPVFEKVRWVDQDTMENWFRGHPEPDDILFVTKGSPGRCCLVPDPVNFCIAQDMLALRADKTKISQKFLFALLRSPTVQYAIGNLHVGTLIPHFKKGDFNQLFLRIPTSRKVQDWIGELYFRLSYKIELNRQMNATLEAMAQALFKSWFVDFDPVIDNALVAGNPIPAPFADRAAARAAALNNGTANRTTAAPFPNAFHHTDTLGYIPKGWEVHKLSGFLQVKHGFAFKGQYFSGEKTTDILVTPGNFHIGGGFKDAKLKFYDGPVDADYVLDAGELIVTMTDLSKAGDTLGFPAFVPSSANYRYLHNQRIGRIVFNEKPLGKFYANQLLRSRAYRTEVLGSLSGSTVKHTSPSKITAFEFPFSGGNIESRLNESLRPIQARVDKNNESSLTLSRLRDTLLPKLISGELRIPDAEKLAAEAGA